MYGSTLWPGSWPPSPGFAPCAILIWSWSAFVEVVDVDAEAARGDLLDRRAARVAVRVADVAHRVLAALAGVRLAAEAVHRDRERLVRLARERAERHRAGREALDDLGRRLDLVERDRRRRCGSAAARAASRAAPRPRSRAARTPRRSRRRRGAPRAGGARSSPGSTGGTRRRRARRRRRRAGAGRRSAGRRARAGRAPRGRAPRCRSRRSATACPVKCRSTSAGLEPDRLEDLRAAVGRDRRDAHLRDRLQEALRDALDRALLRLLGGHRPRAASPPSTSSAERLEHHVRVDRGRAVADQRRELVHVARLARLDHEPGLQARALAHEVVVHRRDGEQRRDRDAVGADVAVGEDQDVDAARRAPRRPRGRSARAPRRGPATPSATGQVMSIVCALKTSESTWRSASSSSSRRIGCVDHELARVLGRLAEQVPLGADARRDAHHDRLARRVDRRVRDLREELLEVASRGAGAGRRARRARGRCPSSRSPPRRSARAARGSPSGPPACSRTRAGASAAARSRGTRGGRSGRSLEVDDALARTTRRTAGGPRSRA